MHFRTTLTSTFAQYPPAQEKVNVAGLSRIRRTPLSCLRAAAGPTQGSRMAN